MRQISMQDIVEALRHCDPHQLAAAIAGAEPQVLANTVRAAEQAAVAVATYPPADVQEEADALLYEVLRWPIADSVPGWERQITPETFATRRGIPIEDARATLARLHQSEALAANELLAAGTITHWTLEQAQVTECIESLMAHGVVPTRDSVRAFALDEARMHMRPSDGESPIAYSLDEDLAPRIMSPSPKVHAAIWLNRMEAEPPAAGNLADRTAYLSRASSALGLGALEHARVIQLRQGHDISASRASMTADAPPEITMGLVG